MAEPLREMPDFPLSSGDCLKLPPVLPDGGLIAVADGLTTPAIARAEREPAGRFGAVPSRVLLSLSDMARIPLRVSGRLGLVFVLTHWYILLIIGGRNANRPGLLLGVRPVTGPEKSGPFLLYFSNPQKSRYCAVPVFSLLHRIKIQASPQLCGSILPTGFWHPVIPRNTGIRANHPALTHIPASP